MSERQASRELGSSSRHGVQMEWGLQHGRPAALSRESSFLNHHALQGFGADVEDCHRRFGMTSFSTFLEESHWAGTGAAHLD